MEKEKKPLSEKECFPCYGVECKLSFKPADVKQAVKEAYSEFVSWLGQKNEIEIIDEIFKDKFGFELN